MTLRKVSGKENMVGHPGGLKDSWSFVADIVPQIAENG